MMPYTFTVTSHIIITFALALLVILTVIIYGFYKHGTHFLGLFVPSGVPPVLLPLLVLIEVISFISRPMSLSVRLFANMLAGHITLKVFARLRGPCSAPPAAGRSSAPLPLAMTVALTALELLVAVPAGLRLRHPHLHLPQRRPPSRPLTGRRQASHPVDPKGVRPWNLKLRSSRRRSCLPSAWAAAAIGLGNIFGNFLSGALRNPSAADGQFGRAFSASALPKALGIFSLLIALLLLFAV